MHMGGGDRIAQCPSHCIDLVQFGSDQFRDGDLVLPFAVSAESDCAEFNRGPAELTAHLVCSPEAAGPPEPN